MFDDSVDDGGKHTFSCFDNYINYMGVRNNIFSLYEIVFCASKKLNK